MHRLPVCRGNVNCAEPHQMTDIPPRSKPHLLTAFSTHQEEEHNKDQSQRPSAPEQGDSRALVMWPSRRLEQSQALPSTVRVSMKIPPRFMFLDRIVFLVTQFLGHLRATFITVHPGNQSTPQPALTAYASLAQLASLDILLGTYISTAFTSLPLTLTYMSISSSGTPPDEPPAPSHLAIFQNRALAGFRPSGSLT